MAIEVSIADVQDAERFLASYLTERVPEADFSPGSAIRDLCVNAIAYTLALMRAEINQVSRRQSLLDLADESRVLTAQGADTTDVDQAVDALLSNYFISRRGASYAKVVARMEFDNLTPSAFIPGNAVFSTANGRQYALEDRRALSLNLRLLPPEVSANNQLVRVVDVRLESLVPGVAGNISSGTPINTISTGGTGWLRGVTLSDGYGGADKETTAELLERAPLALATRNLVNARSIKNTLMDTYENLRKVEVVSSGDPEMSRDAVTLLGGAYNIRTGGMVDVYVHVPVATDTVTVASGQTYRRGDGAVVVLRDTSIDFEAESVTPGDIIQLYTQFVVAGNTQYVVESVSKNELTIETRVPFPQFTDEVSPVTYVSYSVGDNPPSFDTRVATRNTGLLSRSTRVADGFVLPPGVVYGIQSITSSDGLQLYSRVNSLTSGSGFRYTVTNAAPATANTPDAVTTLQFAPAPASNTSFKVVYQRADGLEVIHERLRDPEERTVGTDVVCKALHPIYLEPLIRYGVRPGVMAPDEADVLEWASNYITTLTRLPRLREIVGAMQEKFPGVVVDLPRLSYTLHAPDGQLFKYTTSDYITPTPTATTGAVFTDAATLRTVNFYGQGVDLATKLAKCADVGSGATNVALRAEADASLREYLAYVGVSERTCRVLPDPNYFSVQVIL